MASVTASGGVSFETINRDETALRAMLKYYVTQVPRLAVHPLAGLALEEVDSSTKNVRAFTEAEETNIWKAAEAREEKRRQERASGNAWREKRGRTLLPSLENRYTDVLLPAMKIARLTGLRRGEMFSLDWEHVDLHTKEITLEREKAKDFEQRTIPLSKEAVAVLRVWKMQRGGRGAVFVNEQGGRVAYLKRGFYALLEDAGINRSNGARVSWNSWRHTFATSLIHRGVDVATVKDLMGHSSVSTVIDRYLSTDVEKKKDAIAQLDVSG